jgi:hypothetical protein
MTTLLDTRSRPTTDAERARSFAKTDPAVDEVFALCTEPGDCAACGCRIELLSPLWVRLMPSTSSEVQLAQLDDNYAGEDVFAFHCFSCARKHFEDAVRDYANERAQADREERLQRACVAEAAGDLTPDHWYTIMQANLGYCEPHELPSIISAMCEEYRERYGARVEYLETVRAKLYEFVPTPRLTLTVGDTVDVEHLAGGLARFSFTAKVSVR